MHMRLYRLLARVGRRKRRPYPWFDAPAAGFPRSYDGWVWDPAAREWIPADVADIDITIDVPKFTEPTQPPRPAQSLYVEGWHWNGRAGVWEESSMPSFDVLVFPDRPPKPTAWPSRTQPAEILGWRYSFTRGVWEETPMEGHTEMVEEKRGPKPAYPPGTAVEVDREGWSWFEDEEKWVATTVIGEPIGFTPPRSLPPEIDFAAVELVFNVDQQYAIFVQTLTDLGLNQSDVRNISASMVDGFWNMSRSASVKDRAAAYQESLTINGKIVSDKLESIGVYGAVIALAAIVGAVIGMILAKIITPLEDYFVMRGGIITYLLGPENWTYSRFLGFDDYGREFYSSCDGIGTEYVRHKRGYGIGQLDIIDFPGGFIESGYKFPYFVKYTWEYWELSYVGMLESAGPDAYALKVGKNWTGAIIGGGSFVPDDEWCLDFRFYL